MGGPAVTDIPANLKLARDFFTKPCRSYKEFQVQCQALRIFAFAGVTGGCVLALVIDAPKSSYWRRMSPMYALYNIKDVFTAKPPPMFHTEKVQHDADVPVIAKELITKRRLPDTGS